jgi:hypothetical protein
VLRVRDVYPGSELLHSGTRVKKIPDPGTGSASKNLRNRIRIKEFKYPDLDILPIPDPGSDGKKGTGSRIQGSTRHRIPDRNTGQEKETLSQISEFSFLPDDLLGN